ncbi:MAG: helix-turn-helix domain-containing protein [Treponema sp.]|nr:helix-turn-helix domain-containing protein [Treponema sp.]
MKKSASVKNTTINQRVRILRKSINLTQKEFAQRIYVSTSFQTLTELGKKRVLDRHIKLIVTAFGVNESWLRTGEGEMFEKDVTPDYKITDTVKIFKQLAPFFQDLIIDLMQKLLEYEKKEGNREGKRKN